MKKSILLIIATAGLFSCKQTNKSTPKTVDVETVSSANSIQNDNDIYSKYGYTDSNGKCITIQNGYPRGGMKYTAPNGNVFSYAVFWTRIINETHNPLEFKIDLPINSYEISNFPGKHFQILIPDDTITLDNVPLINQTNLKSFLDNNIHKPSLFKRTINPKESSGFYFVMLISTLEATGMTRTELSLKGQDIFYKVSRHSKTILMDEKEIHCGSINLKNLTLQK